MIALGKKRGLSLGLLCLLMPAPFLVCVPRSWTFLVYIAADNSLSDFAQFNINQMKMVANPNVNILAYWCPPPKNGQKIGQKVVVTPGVQTVVGTDTGVDSGSSIALLNACNWAINNYPSEKFALVLWNHGSGILNRKRFPGNELRGFCYDDTTGNHLDDISLRSVLNTVKSARAGKKIDIVGFDACLMAGFEVASALSDYASYLVASEQTEPGYGWSYGFLQNLTSGSDQATVACSIASTYNTFYNQNNVGQKTNNYTLSVMNLANYAPADAAVNALSVALINGLKTSLKTPLKAAVQKSISRPFDERTYIDLLTFCTKLKTNVAAMTYSAALNGTVAAIQAAVTNAINMVTPLVVANFSGSALPGARGVSIYYPQWYVEPSYARSYFGQRSAWNSFITASMNS